jgi:hypothetical protein
LNPTVADSGTVWRSLHVICFAIALAGCAGGRGTEHFQSMTMPDPGGCYVMVYEEPQFTGPREFINGPVKHSTLEALPFRANWRRRIRSAQVGANASVTIWDREGLQGASQTLLPDSRHPVLPAALSGRVQSLEIRCGP